MADFGSFVNGVSLKASELNTLFQKTTFAPVMRQSAIVNAAASSSAFYFRVNKVIVCTINFLANSAGTASNQVEIDLPVTASSGAARVIGHGFYFNFGAANPISLIRVVRISTTRIAFLSETATTMTQYLGLTNGPAITIASNDRVFCSFAYEAA